MMVGQVIADAVCRTGSPFLPEGVWCMADIARHSVDSSITYVIQADSPGLKLMTTCEHRQGPVASEIDNQENLKRDKLCGR